MTKDELLDRLAALEAQRLKHETKGEALLMERDSLIYDALTAEVPLASVAEIARRLEVDRSWPYRIRDEYPERLRRYRARTT